MADEIEYEGLPSNAGFGVSYAVRFPSNLIPLIFFGATD
jgi:hypothetical protein